MPKQEADRVGIGPMIIYDAIDIAIAIKHVSETIPRNTTEEQHLAAILGYLTKAKEAIENYRVWLRANL